MLERIILLCISNFVHENIFLHVGLFWCSIFFMFEIIVRLIRVYYEWSMFEMNLEKGGKSELATPVESGRVVRGKKVPVQEGLRFGEC